MLRHCCAAFLRKSLISIESRPVNNLCLSFHQFRHQQTQLSISQINVVDFRHSSGRQITTSSNSNIFWKDMGDMQSTSLPDTTGIERKNKIKLTDAEWKAKLTPEQYQVCRNHGTERAWTGDLLESKGKGIYQCACCGADLFNSSTKFDSGSGWPSFYDAMKEKNEDLPTVDTHTDRSHGMVRTEVLCGRCDSHLGHVFNDGPQPTGLRYCINSVSLKFKKEPGSKGKQDL